MFLTSVIITSGVLITGVKVLHEEKRKKETPWTVYAEKMAKRQAAKRSLSPYSLGKKRLLRSGLSKIADGQTALKKFKEEPPRLPVFGSLLGIRSQQLKEINRHRNDADEISEVEKRANRELKYSSLALALTTGAALIYTPLNLLAVPIILLTQRQYVVRVYHAFKEQKVTVALLELIGCAGPLAMGHFFVAAFAVHFSNLSRKLLIKTEDHSMNSLTNVFGLKPSFVWIQQGDVEVEIPFDNLQVDDMVVVHAGQTIPIDGMITSGVAQIDQRALTGESQPVEKSIGDSVFASTYVYEGKIGIQVEKTGADTVAAQIGDILNSTSDFKSQVQARGTKIVDQGALPTIVLSALTLPLLGPESAFAMLCAAFGYHMKYAAPVAVLTYLRMASENGVLIKDGRSLELLSEVDTFVFDKTGTLTCEVPTVGQIYIMPCGYATNGYAENDLLTYAAAAEDKQTHPIAKAILNEASNRELNLPSIEEAQVKLGYGLKVRVALSENRGSHLIHVGSRRFMEMESITIPSNYQKIQETCYEEGYSLVYVAIDNQLGGAIELVPTIRPEAKGIISALKSRNMSVVIISGDHEAPTQKLAQELGIDDYFAETLPQNKASIVEQLQKACPDEGRKGKSVCFVGDGINDSIALKTANVSISLRGASTAATDSASIILMDSSLNQLLPLLDMANSLDANLKRGTIMTVVPGIICAGGVFFLHFGILSAILLYYASLGISLSNALLPLLTHQKNGHP